MIGSTTRTIVGKETSERLVPYLLQGAVLHASSPELLLPRALKPLDACVRHAHVEERRYVLSLLDAPSRRKRKLTVASERRISLKNITFKAFRQFSRRDHSRFFIPARIDRPTYSEQLVSCSDPVRAIEGPAGHLVLAFAAYDQLEGMLRYLCPTGSRVLAQSLNKVAIKRKTH